MLPGGERQQWIARRVILALPQRALRELLLRSHASLGELKTVEPLLDGVGVFSAFKLYASYAEPWWTRGWAPHGYTVTDLPIRQVYYGSGVGGTATDNDRVLMMIYADEAPALFWGPLLAGPQRGRGNVTHASSTSVAAPIIDEAMAQVAELHGLRDLPRPEWWACHNWGADGGAWHAWQPGVSVPETMTQIRHPFADLPLFVCGEAFSRMQGWIEGALTNTEKMLQAPPFDLPAPRWVPADYDLGP
jgi:monoamine oxidase